MDEQDEQPSPASIFSTAWKRYVDKHGAPPDGSVAQMRELLQCVTEVGEKQIRKRSVSPVPIKVGTKTLVQVEGIVDSMHADAVTILVPPQTIRQEIEKVRVKPPILESEDLMIRMPRKDYDIGLKAASIKRAIVLLCDGCGLRVLNDSPALEHLKVEGHKQVWFSFGVTDEPRLQLYGR